MPEKLVPVSEARQKLPGLSTAAKTKMDRYLITQHGQPQSVLLGYHDYQSMKAAVDLLQRPQAIEDIGAGLSQLRAGERLSPEAAEQRLRELTQAGETRELAAELAKGSGLDAKLVTTVVELLVNKMISDFSAKRQTHIPGVGVAKITAPGGKPKARPKGTSSQIEIEPEPAVAELLIMETTE